MSQSILIIDDAEDIHALLGVRLRQEQTVLHFAFSAREGLEMAQRLAPDLILLDVNLPDLSGFDVCRSLKSQAVTAQIPVIFLSGVADAVNKVQGLDLGAIDYVVKPFDAAELMARVRSGLRIKRYQDMLAHRAQLDALTGLWNRSYLNQRLEQEFSAVRRYGRSVTVILLDLDLFKTINDTMGHPMGDRVLQGVGELLANSTRASDIPCRYGGEEFCLILSETSLLDGAVVAEKIRGQLKKLTWQERGKTLTITGSFGVASLDAAQTSPHHVLEYADEALYLAKNLGRDRVEVYQPK